MDYCSQLQPSLATVSPTPIGERARPASGRSWIGILLRTADRYFLYPTRAACWTFYLLQLG